VPKTNSLFINTLNGIESDQIPIWLMRQAGRYLSEYREVRKNTGTFLDLCYSPDQAAEVTLQPINRFGFDAAIIFSDILVVPDALGQQVSFKEGIGPVLTPIANSGDIKELRFDGLRDFLEPVYSALKIVRAELPIDTALIGFAGAPWTIATYMVEGGTSREFAKTKTWAFSEPDQFSQLIEILISAITDHLIAQVEAGADALQIFDSWAGMLPDTAFEKWSLDPISRIVAGVKCKCPNVPIIVFPRLAGHRYLKVAAINGVSAVSLDQTISLNWVRETLQPGTIVQGNLDPIFLLAGGDAMKAEAERILNILSKKPFVFNLGHGVLPPTPPDHVADLREFVSSWLRDNR
tara:strand:+ start:16502 stop:17551 length:1050 start_codon:yes stop_codon:yes gene_type:complete